MRSKKAGTLLTIVLVFWAVAAVSQDKPSVPEQVQFSAEDETVKRPVSITEDAWEILKKDAGVLEVLTSQSFPVDHLPTSWFTASEVHLNGSKKSDLVVVGGGTVARGKRDDVLGIFAATARAEARADCASP